MRRFHVCVIGDADVEKDQYDFCEQLGKFLASQDFITITGGKGGVMEAVNKGVSQKGGIAVSILPGEHMDDANEYSSVIIPTGLGHARNSLTVKASDLVIAIGGKAGTLSEISFAWIYKKRIIAVRDFGGWSSSLATTKLDDRRNDRIIEVKGMEDLKNEIINAAEELGWQ